MTPFVGELIGTMILIVFGGGVVAGSLLKFSKGENSGWVVITMAWGLAVAMGVYAIGGASGAHLNPAVSVALAIVGDLLFYKQIFLGQASIAFWLVLVLVLALLVVAQLSLKNIEGGENV